MTTFNFSLLNNFKASMKCDAIERDNDEKKDYDEWNYSLLNFSDVRKSSTIFIGTYESCFFVRLTKNYLKRELADELFDILKNIRYNSDEDSMVKMGGFHVKIPRKQIAYGENSNGYSFSGTTIKPYDWNRCDDSINSIAGRLIKKLKNTVADTTPTEFNYALVNNYIDGTNSIGYHSDDERNLGKTPSIAGISLGQEREMYFKSTLTNEIIKLSLPHNSLLIMYYPTNRYWKHAILKSNKKIGQRISITFRNLVN
jgi:alkylated DNA repair dioxygenase AlkB